MPRAVNDARNAKIGEDDREAELPAGKTMAQIVESVSKMNKKERARVLERSKQPEQPKRRVCGPQAQKARAGFEDPEESKEPPRNQVGGSSGSGIPRDPITGRAL